MNFADLGLAPALINALNEQGLSSPTLIQQQAIPAVLQGRDVMGQAQTGSGKTLAYALPVLQRFMALAPPREDAPRQRRTQVLV
jgi:ATP-dependent RNA helicase RhlE